MIICKSSKIKKIFAREILDSRGNPTLEVDLKTDDGIFRASVPCGASKGKYEAFELRDKGKRFFGKGVLKAVKKINKILAPKIEGKDPTKQKEIDELMIKLDGTQRKSNLGANTILAISIAVCKAGAKFKNLPLFKYISEISKNKISFPRPSFNIINGGIHAGNDLDFQEFMIVPREKIFSKNLRIAAEIYQKLKEVIKKNYGALATNVGDEGGFAPPLKDPKEALNLILKAAKDLKSQKKIEIFLDIAASQFFSRGKYKMKIGNFESENLADYYLSLVQKYPIFALEDPFFEDDFFGWKILREKLGKNFLIVGDDLLATNIKRIKLAKENELCNGIIIKLNQIGTVSEAIEAVNLAKSFGWKIIVSHRSGETNDDFISDFAVGIGADFIKAGAPCRGERVAKYNQLLRIEESIKK